MATAPAQNIPTKPVKKIGSKRDKNGRFTKAGPVSVNNDITNPLVNSAVRSDQGINNTVNFPDDNQIFPQTPPGESGIANKEMPPVIERIYQEEAAKAKELKEQLAQLEKEAEVKEIRGEIELPEAVKKAGVEVIGEETPISETPSVVLPLDDTKIYQIYQKIKTLHQDLSASVSWMVIWCVRQLARMGFKLKDDHGKIIREREDKKNKQISNL